MIKPELVSWYGMKRVILSGYFNPLHGGHLDMIEEGMKLGDKLIVIINNDKQQLLKKGKIILDEQNRMRLVNALHLVDEVILAEDETPSVVDTLRHIRERYPMDELVFGNGGDRSPAAEPVPEVKACKELDIEMVYGLGAKTDSSTRINRALGNEK